MARVLLLLLAGLLTAVGALWTAQALGWVEGGAMAGSQMWAVVGPLVAGLGVALAFVVVRGPR